MSNAKHAFIFVFLLFALTFSNQISFAELSEKVIAMADDYRVNQEQENKKERQRINHITEEDRVAKAVAKLYKTVKYKDTKKVVKLVYKHARKQKIKPMLVIGLIASESGFRRTAVSSHGAIGYTQVLPKYHQDKIAGRDVFDPKVNIEVGIKILSDCIKKRKNIERALGCYNGATTVEKRQKYVNQVRRNQRLIAKLASQYTV